jgi:hypothetical protein
MRKWSALALVAMSGLVVVGCDDGVAPSPQGYEVHVVGHFDQTWVRVHVDGHPLYDGYATTNPLIGVAAIVRATAPSGRHQIRVTAGGTTAEFEFELSEYLYAIASRDATDGAITVVVTRERPLYD